MRLTLFSKDSAATAGVATSTVLPSGWAVHQLCVVDTASHILPSYYTVSSSNTPASCVSKCAAKGYSMAGTENGVECYCANDYGGGMPQNAPAGDCTAMTCPGDSSQFCGGPYRIRIFSKSSFAPSTLASRSTSTLTAAPDLPTGWILAQSCMIDSASRVLASYQTQNILNSPTWCIATCAAQGYLLAGVEYGTDCHCAHTFNGGTPLAAEDSDCTIACPGAPGLVCGGIWRMSLYAKSTYFLADSWVGPGFLNGFSHQAIIDPTHGRVNYVDQPTALAQNLTYASQESFIIRADSTHTLSPTGPGRNSVRLLSHKRYTTHVAV